MQGIFQLSSVTLIFHTHFRLCSGDILWMHVVKSFLDQKCGKMNYFHSHVTKECAFTNPEWQILKYTLTASYSSVWQLRNQELQSTLSHCVAVTSLRLFWSYMVQSTFFFLASWMHRVVCIEFCCLVMVGNISSYEQNSSIVFWIGRIKNVIPCVSCSY